MAWTLGLIRAHTGYKLRNRHAARSEVCGLRDVLRHAHSCIIHEAHVHSDIVEYVHCALILGLSVMLELNVIVELNQILELNVIRELKCHS